MLNELAPKKGAVKKRKRVGRGPGSGHGKTSTRGHKGQGARRGLDIKPWFEGGQTPLFRRIPKRGFTNIFKKEYEIVNLKSLNCFEDGEIVDKSKLEEKGFIKSKELPVKILGDGELNKKLTLIVDKISASARDKVLKAGGSIQLIKE